MRDSTIERCELCNSNEYLYGHHTSYYPEAQIWVCGSCHAKIHKTKGYFDILNPERERPDSYKHASPTGLCSDCAAEYRLARKPASELGVKLHDCYHPSRKCSSCGADVNSIIRLDDELVEWYESNS